MPFAYRVQWIFTVNFDQLIGKWNEKREKLGGDSLSRHYTRALSLSRTQSFVGSLVRSTAYTISSMNAFQR